jgi:multidrug efflux pump subunit AcrA (membrane-fusion protein)
MRFTAHRTVLSFLNKRKKIVIPVIILLGILTWFLLPKNEKPIETEKVKRGELTQSIAATGKINALNTVNLSFLAGGRLTYVSARKGDFVEKGQTIASLDTRTVQKNLESAMRDYAKQRNNFEQTKDDNNPSLTIDSQPTEVKRILQNNQSIWIKRCYQLNYKNFPDKTHSCQHQSLAFSREQTQRYQG